ncbi:unnamed protein product [Nesidiocoris tenuis]|uniref:Uncharacterized protein n=1 Tax=Nesidiocoris tenuis TaxID=355587 RepID=A0A6H5HF13_9HEMI|nr:unnamed protein product [Nesidiocoris tenuis]
MRREINVHRIFLFLSRKKCFYNYSFILATHSRPAEIPKILGLLSNVEKNFPVTIGFDPNTTGLLLITIGLLPIPAGLSLVPAGLLQAPAGLLPVPAGLLPSPDGVDPITTGLHPITIGLLLVPAGLRPSSAAIAPITTGGYIELWSRQFVIARIAQSVEHQTLNLRDQGSSPCSDVKFLTVNFCLHYIIEDFQDGVQLDKPGPGPGSPAACL